MNKWSVLAVVGLGTFVSVLDSSTVNVSLPAIANDLGADTAMIQWDVMGYLLTITGLLLAFGRLGRSRAATWSRGIHGLGGPYGVVTTIDQLITLRVIQGIGSAGAMAISPAITANAFPRS